MKSPQPILCRSEFLELLSRHLKQAQQHKRVLGLLFCNIRSFSRINKLYGFDIGDQVLHEIIERLQPLAKSVDGFSRIGGNEFALILPFLENPLVAQLAAKKVLMLMSDSGFGGDTNIHCNPAIGVALTDSVQSNPQSICLLAESALSQAKNTNQLLVTLHDQHHGKDQTDWVKSLDLALLNSDLELFYQPKVSIAKNLPCYSEALIRWRKEEGFISPVHFVPAAEKAGLIQPMTRWIIKNAIRSMSNYSAQLNKLGVSINISGACLEMHDLGDLIEQTLKLWNVDPKRLTLEITESVFMMHLETSMALITKLRKKLGIRISIDDFGTGFSSLECFKELPADELKIDRSFIIDIKNNPLNRMVVETIVQLGKNFNLDVVAQGVEDRETYEIIKDLGCDYAQGYYLCRPLAAEDYVVWSEDTITNRGRIGRYS